MNINRKLLLSLLVSITSIVFFLLTIDVVLMVAEVAAANYIFLAPAIALYLISILFRTIRWQILLRHLRPIPTKRLYPVVVIGYMANNLLPFRMGELVRSYYIGEREGINKASALMTILVERVLDALVLLLFIAGIALFVPVVGIAESFADMLGVPWVGLLIILSSPFVLGFCALLLLAFFPLKSKAIAVSIFSLLPRQFEQKLQKLTDMLLDGLTPLRSPKTLAILFLFSIPIWLFEAGLFLFISFSFGLDAFFYSLGDLAAANILITSLSNIGSSLPATPGGIGLFELVARETLIMLSFAPIDRALAGGYATVVHAALLIPMIVLGQLFLWIGHVSLRGLTQRSKKPLDEQTEPVLN